jgi:hypothetical protein
MSTRGTNFLYDWISQKIPEAASADVISVADLTNRLFADAKAAGVSSDEIEEDTGSVYQAIFDAIVHHDGAVAD